MHVRRAIMMIATLSLGLFLCGCGMVEGYEAGAVLQVVENPGATVTITANTVDNNSMKVIFRNYPRRGAGEQSLDILVTSIRVQLVDMEGTALPVVTYPGNLRIAPTSEGAVTLFEIVPQEIVEAIREDQENLDIYGNFRADMVILGKEVDMNGNTRNSLSVTDSAAVVVLYE